MTQTAVPGKHRNQTLIAKSVLFRSHPSISMKSQMQSWRRTSQAGLRVLNDVWREALEAVYRQLRGRNVADGERWMAETLTQALQTNEPAGDRLPLEGVDA